jgi:hypothetical protein
VEWDLEQLLGYLSTWSAIRRARELGQEEVLRSFADEFAAIWGDHRTRCSLAWPINMRLGRL